MVLALGWHLAWSGTELIMDTPLRVLIAEDRTAKAAPGEPSAQAVIINARDATERKRAEEENRFQAHLLEVVEEAVIATDAESRIIYWNRFAERLYGWPAKEALGKNIGEMISADNPKVPLEIVAGLF